MTKQKAKEFFKAEVLRHIQKVKDSPRITGYDWQKDQDNLGHDEAIITMVGESFLEAFWK